MTLWQKLNLKNQSKLVIHDNFAALKDHLPELSEKANQKVTPETDFFIAFATKLSEVAAYANDLKIITAKDPVIWLCYPKGTSKKYKCEFNRDNGWQAMGAIGYEGVRMVAIDQDWSALRFRKVDQIKTITRSEKMALSREAKKRSTKK